MYKSRAFEIINKFSKEELKRFVSFVNSPYHNTNNNLIKLTNSLSTFHQKQISSEKLYSKLFPGKKFNSQVLNNLSSELYKLIREFFVVEHSKNDEDGSIFILLSELENRVMDNIFKYELEKVLDTKKVEFKIKNLSHLTKSRILLKYSDHLILRNFQDKTTNILKEASDQTLMHFLFDSIISISTIRMNESAFNEWSTKSLFQEYLDRMDLNKLIFSLKEDSYKNDLLKYYLILLKDFEERSKDYEWELKFINAFYKKYEKLFSRSFKYDVIEEMLNSYINLCMRGNTEMFHEAARIIKIQMKEDLIKAPYNKYIPYVCFRNGIRILGISGDFNSRDKFIEQSVELLTPDIREDAYRLAIAEVKKSEYKFKEAIANFICVKNIEMITKYDVRFNLIQCYYHLNMIDDFYNTCRASKKFLQTNNNVSDIHGIHNENFVDGIKKLMDIKLLKDIKKEDALFELDKLKKFVDSVDRINARDFLINQIEDVRLEITSSK